MIDVHLQQLLEDGIDVAWFHTFSREGLRSQLANLKAHRCRLDAVEANVIVAINRLDRARTSRARPSDAADDIKDATGASSADAHRKARRASLFDRWPQVSRALAEGHITAAHADLLCGISTKHHAALELDLADLLAAAAEQSVDDFGHALRRWRDATATAAGDNPHQQRRDRRGCSIQNQPDGMVRLSALLDPESGGVVRNALTRRAQQHLRSDQESGDGNQRTYQQRLVDALTDTCAEDGSGRPGEPTVVVTIALNDLRADLAGQVLGTGPVSAETVRKLACEGGIIPMVLGSNSAILDVGRRSRLATSSQRLALATQYDHQCAVPGCDREFEWCHIHHIHHWDRGGPTNLANLIPVCSRHHSQIHDGRLTIERVDGTDRWHRRPSRIRANLGFDKGEAA